ncbi:Ras GTPase-activating protein isoform X10-like [Oopsacas minuta]|uniref:Ras GTPase-activating protein isoform X10-like n=1 Tax=Oopsacas minuta TaxID=111878 RepID=A0AAV7JKX9_9METZ|nr:Ras GTPase-activating protein isoform X10-like [Oopsacas minuta]
MERPNNVMDGMVWLTDQINQSEVDFTRRYLVHNSSEHKIYFHSDKPDRIPTHVDDILETLTSTIEPSLSLPHASLARQRSNSMTGVKEIKPTTPGIPRRPSLTKRLKLQRASSLSEKKTDVRKVKDYGRSFKSLDSLDDVGVILGEPGSVLELQRDPTPCLSIVNTSLMTRFIFTYCLRITVPPINSHNNKSEHEECGRSSSVSKTVYLCVQTDLDMYKWLHSISADLERIRNRRFHLYPNLSITISEVKGVAPKKNLFCEVCLNSVPYSRTSEKLSNKGVLFWGEKFEFSEFPPVHDITVLLYKGKTKRPQEVGRVEIPAVSLYGQGVVEKWYSLKLDRERKKPQTTIRIKLHYQVLNILPFIKYEDLQSYIVDDYHIIIKNLAPQLPVKHKDSLAKNLVRMFYSTGDVTRYLVDVVVSEVSEPNMDSNLIFRGNSLATKSMDYYMRLIASQYLQSVLVRPLVRYLNDAAECEVDPERIPNTFTPLQTQNNLLRHVHDIWEAIYKSRSNIPVELQIVFHGIQNELGKDKHSISNTVVIACIFLRFFCAAIMSPSLFDIIKEYPSEKGARKLTLVAKTLQTLANFSRFEAKESYLTFLNGWLEREQGKMSEFISYVSNFSLEKRDSFHLDLNVNPTPLQIVSLGVELSTLHHFLHEVTQTVPPQSQEPLMPLTILLNALTCIESAFNESKDRILWINSTPEKCITAVGVGSYYKDSTTNYTESESTGDETSDIENSFLKWPQKVPSTDLTWSKKDVILYKDSISMRSSSEDENYNPVPPPVPGRGTSIRESQEHINKSSIEYSSTLSPLEKLIDHQSLDDIQDRLEEVQKSFKIVPNDPERSKPFVRRNSPNLSNYRTNNEVLSPSKSANQLAGSSHNLSKHISVDTAINKYKNVNEIRRHSNLCDRLPPKSNEYIPKLQYSRSDTGDTSRLLFNSKRLPNSNTSIHNLNSNKTHIPNDQNGNYRYRGSTHIKIEKRTAKSPTNQSIYRSTSSIQVISKSPSPPTAPNFTKTSSADNPRGVNSPDNLTPPSLSPSYRSLDPCSGNTKTNSIFSVPQRPSHRPKTIEITQSLERINNMNKQHSSGVGALSKLSETIALGHEKLERKLSYLSGGNTSGEEECGYYRKECTRMQRDVSRLRAENQELNVNLTAKQKELDRWRGLAVEQGKELKKVRENSELLSLNKQIIDSRKEVMKLKMENEHLRQPPAISIRNTDNESLRDQIETWKGLALDRLNRIRCLEASNATLMNGITQLETLQDIMTNGDDDASSD